MTPLTLRIGTVGGYTEKIIDKNTPIPIERSKTFTTSRDGQERVKIRVYQGEDNRSERCELLGEFEFSGFRIALRGDVKIEVTFEIDSNGIVNVSATDTEIGTEDLHHAQPLFGTERSRHPSLDRQESGHRARRTCRLTASIRALSSRRKRLADHRDARLLCRCSRSPRAPRPPRSATLFKR